MDWRDNKAWDNHLTDMVFQADQERYGDAWLDGREEPKHTGILSWNNNWRNPIYQLTEDDLIQE